MSTQLKIDPPINAPIELPSIKTKLCLDTTKAKNGFGWEPKVSIDDGIKRTMGWYKDYFGDNGKKK